MRPLFDFAYFPQFDQKIEILAELAPEDWGYSHSSSRRKHPVLRSYLNYTLKRLLEENKVIEHTEIACFNTGLVTPN